MSISSVNGSSGTVNRYTYNAVGGETSISGTDSNGATISYLVGKEEVYVNGVLLVRTADYTATNGATITLVNALVAGDVIEIVTFSSFAIPTAISSATVTAKGDLLVGTGASTVTNLPVGADGTTLVANSASATGMAWAGPMITAGKNGVINSGMDIWQRGTSVALAASSPAYTADRWYVTNGANQATTISRQTTADTTNLPNIQYCLRFQRNSGQTGTANTFIANSFETINSIPFASKTVTMSFYARAGANYSPTSSLLLGYIISGTGTDQNRGAAGYTGESAFASISATLTTTWQRFTLSGTVSATATEIATLFACNPIGTAGAADYFEITGVQLELGSVATAFSRNSGTLQGELAACQRYYMRWTAPSGNSLPIATGAYYSTTVMYPVITFPVPMRVQPTGINASAASAITTFVGGSGAASTAITFNSSSTTSMDIAVTTATKTVGQGGGVTLNSGGAWLEVTGTEL
jgi:hypothetical protein